MHKVAPMILAIWLVHPVFVIVGKLIATAKALRIHAAGSRSEATKWGVGLLAITTYVSQEVHFWLKWDWVPSVSVTLGGLGMMAYFALRMVPLDSGKQPGPDDAVRDSGKGETPPPRAG